MKMRSKRQWLPLAFFGILAATVLVSLDLRADEPSPKWDAPARAARKKNPVPSDTKSIADGKNLYITQCIKCHGDSGKGDGPSAKDLNPRPKDLSDSAVAGQTDGALFWKITTGRKPMPTFETLMTDEERWKAINYVRTLQPSSTTQPTK